MVECRFCQGSGSEYDGRDICWRCMGDGLICPKCEWGATVDGGECFCEPAPVTWNELQDALERAASKGLVATTVFTPEGIYHDGEFYPAGSPEEQELALRFCGPDALTETEDVPPNPVVVATQRLEAKMDRVFGRWLLHALEDDDG